MVLYFMYVNANECVRKSEEFQYAQHLRLIKNEAQAQRLSSGMQLKFLPWNK